MKVEILISYYKMENAILYILLKQYIKQKIYGINNDTKLYNVEFLTDYQINKIQVDGNICWANTNYYKFNSNESHIVKKEYRFKKKYFS